MALDYLYSVGTATSVYNIFVPGTYLDTKPVILDAATAGYTPAVGDVLCYDTDDTNKHQKYNADTATHVVLGVIESIELDDASTPVQILNYATTATVYFENLGTTGVVTSAEYLALMNALIAKNITPVEATGADDS